VDILMALIKRVAPKEHGVLESFLRTGASLL
jgi:hypothetical protein